TAVALVYLFARFFTATATTQIYTLSLHDALPISTSTSSTAPPSSRSIRSATAAWPAPASPPCSAARPPPGAAPRPRAASCRRPRSEEHTSELQSRENLVCRLLLEKKKKE